MNDIHEFVGMSLSSAFILRPFASYKIMENLHRTLFSAASGDASSSVTQRELQAALEEQEGGAKECCKVQIKLLNSELWKEFHKVTNEMIVTKVGRRMFPLLQLSLSGLEPTSTYSLLLEFRLTDSHRRRFLNGDWQISSSVADHEPAEEDSCVYVHPTSPSVGELWMQETVSFPKLKLSNKEDGNGKVKLCSLHHYQPCVYVVKQPSHSNTVLAQATDLQISSHVFSETQFVAVTAYQNEKITQMKIKHNPFAKAFQSPHDMLPPKTPRENMLKLRSLHVSTGSHQPSHSLTTTMALSYQPAGAEFSYHPTTTGTHVQEIATTRLVPVYQIPPPPYYHTATAYNQVLPGVPSSMHGYESTQLLTPVLGGYAPNTNAESMDSSQGYNWSAPTYSYSNQHTAVYMSHPP